MISSEGKIKVWLLGDVSVKDLTPQEVENLLNEKLAKDYIRQPFARVSVFKYRRRTVAVNGEVQKPGPVDFYGDKPLKIPEAIASAKPGWTKTARKDKSKSSATEKRFNFDYGAFLKNRVKEEDVPVLEDGDVVEVGQSLL